MKYEPDTKHNFNRLYLHEITASAIKADMKRDRYYIVFNWDPASKNAKSKTLAYYSKINRQMDSLNVKTYLVAPRYEYKKMQKQYIQHGYKDKIYVMDREVYGKNKSGTAAPFIEDLVDEKLNRKDSLRYASFIIFQNLHVVAYGSNYHDIISILAVDYPVLKYFNE
jgi:hypothetical protein